MQGSFYKELLLLQHKPYCQDKQRNANEGGIDEFVVAGQPVRKVYIKIVMGRCRILFSNQSNRAYIFEQKQYKSFQRNKAQAYPEPPVNFIDHHRINNVKNNHIEE